MLFGFRLYPGCNFRKFINFGLGVLRSEGLNRATRMKRLILLPSNTLLITSFENTQTIYITNPGDSPFRSLLLLHYRYNSVKIRPLAKRTLLPCCPFLRAPIFVTWMFTLFERKDETNNSLRGGIGLNGKVEYCVGGKVKH